MSFFPYGITQTAKLPAPEVAVELQAPTAKNKTNRVVCIIDTGACGSCMPKHILDAMNLRDYRSQKIRWGSGATTIQRQYAVDLILGSKTLENVWVLETDKEYGLIGRDVLNAYRLLCDGPNRVWSVEPRWA